VTTAGQVIATDIPISLAAGDQVTPSVTFDATTNVFVVTWVDRRRGGTLHDIYATRVTNTGTVLDPDGVALRQTAMPAIEVSSAFGTTHTLLAWRENNDIFGARVTTVGGLALADAAFAISTAAGKQTTPAVVFLGDDGNHFAVAWTDARPSTTGSDIYGAHVEQASGLVANEHLISGNPGNETRPAFSRGRIKKSGTRVEVLVGYQLASTTLNTERAMLRTVRYEP
jgi:hypothetical protein